MLTIKFGDITLSISTQLIPRNKKEKNQYQNITYNDV